MAENAPFDVVRVLGERLSEERRRRIDEVISHRTNRTAMAVEGVRDSHNAAAIIRTADAFGVQTVHVIEGQDQFVFSRKVTQGAHKWVDLSIWSSVDDFARAMRAEGKKVFAASADGEMDLGDIDCGAPMAIVFGNESDGISAGMRDVSDGTFRIRMYGFVESLNVSVAAAVTLASLRSRGNPGLSSEEAEVLRARFYLRAVRAGYDIVMRAMGAQSGQ